MYFWSHPMTAVAMFTAKSVWPVELKCGTIDYYDNFTTMFVLGLAH